MKKTFTLLLSLVMACALSLTLLTGCAAKAVSIEVVEPKTEYYVGDEIDYDNLSAKVTYDDDTVKEGTVKSLNLAVKAKADLSKAGETSYTVALGVITCEVKLTVKEKVEESNVTSLKVVNPKTEYYVDDEIDYDSITVEVSYKDGTSITKTVKELNATVSKADLSKEGSTSYTVTLEGKSDTVEINVTYKPFVMSVREPDFYRTYRIKSQERTGAETVGDFRKTGEVYEVGNANKFIYRPSILAEDADGKNVTISNVATTVKVYEKESKSAEYKLVPDTDLAGIVAISDNTYKFTEEAAGKYYKLVITPDETVYDIDEDMTAELTVEFVVVGGGYNVYDQLGLSVMNDLSSRHWAKDIWKCDIDANYNLTARSDSLKLEADDKYLCEYVGKIDWVILHASIELDADQMPDYYFWTEDTEGYKSAYAELAAFPEQQKLLKGSLRDGVGNGIHFTVTNVVSDSNRWASQLGYGLNMQKAFFSTYSVSVSGNYNGITVPKTDSKGGRRLYAYLDYEKATANPTTHWQVFQMYQSYAEGKESKAFTIKNIAMTGNGGQDTTANFAPASLTMYNCFGSDVTISNVNANAFYVNITCDAYKTDTVKTGIKADNTKLYDAYSNMFFLWRANVTVTNCEFVGAGGPLFILSDGENTKTDNDDGGAFLKVDTKSKLESYSTGGESWYKLYNAQSLIGYIKGDMEHKVFNNVGKTVRFSKNTNGTYTPFTNNTTGDEYVNVIAAIICDPGDLMKGLNNEKLIVRGKYQTVDEDGTVVEEFNTRNQYVKNLSAAVGMDGTKFAPIFQTGNLMTFTDMTNLYTWGASGQQLFDATTDGLSWFTDTHEKLAIYMSAGSQSGSANAPYFGVVVGSAHFDK